MTQTEKMEIRKISVQDWNDLVTKTYGRPYMFQQQNNCKARGLEYLECPTEEYDYTNSIDDIPKKVNNPKMGVQFKAWLKRDPSEPLGPDEKSEDLDMWYERNFYPHVSTIINDLYDKGLLKKGEFCIDIDW